VEVIDSPFDVIIGRPDINKHDITRRMHSHFTEASSNKPSGESESVFLNLNAISSSRPHQTPPIAFGPSPLTASGSVATSSVEEVPMPPLKGINMIEASLNHICTIYQKEELLDILEDDPEDPFWKTDISDLFPKEDSQKVKQSQDEMQLPIIEGNEPWHDNLRALLQEFRDIFRATVGKEPAKVPPMKLDVDLQEWQTPKTEVRLDRRLLRDK